MKETQHTKTLEALYGRAPACGGNLLPEVFHMIGGQAMGGMFLPMHLPVFVAGLLLGPFYGCAIGVITQSSASLSPLCRRQRCRLCSLNANLWANGGTFA